MGLTGALSFSMLNISAQAAPKRAAAVQQTGFNGGRSQVNLNALQTGGDYPFLNCLKRRSRGLLATIVAG